MGKGKKLTAYECGRVSAFREDGLSLRNIAERMDKSVKSIHTFLKNPERYLRKSPAKRPKVITPSMGRRLLRAVRKDRTLSSAMLKVNLSLPVSSRSIRRFLNQNGFKNIKRDRVPLITSKNKLLRFQFANRHKTWDQEWNSVVFSDEKKFNLDGPDGNQKFWYDRSLKQKESYSRRPSGGGGIMVWGAIAHNGKLKLQEVNGRMNAEGYVDMLRNVNLKDEGRRLVGSDWTFQQDNAPCHRANLTKVFLEQEDISVLTWPANSPDLNIIENAWGYMVREVYKGGRQFSTLSLLKKAIFSAWEKIPQVYIQSLYRSMKQRIGEVLVNRGGPTSY